MEQIDPKANPTYQKIVKRAQYMAERADPLSSENIADPTETDAEFEARVKKEEKQSKDKGSIPLVKRMLYTSNRLLSDIHPRVKEAFNETFDNIRLRTHSERRASDAFFGKLEGLNESSNKELSQLL